MRLTALLPTLALAATLPGTHAWSDYETATKCGAKNPAVNTAIQNFCRMQPLMVPSAKAKWGRSFNGFHVAIGGHCNPPQWVPEEWCRKQFTRMCANGNGQGLKNARFGRSACQEWHIDRKALPQGTGLLTRDAMPEAMAEAIAEAMADAEAMPDAMAHAEAEAMADAMPEAEAEAEVMPEEL